MILGHVVTVSLEKLVFLHQSMDFHSIERLALMFFCYILAGLNEKESGNF